MCIEEADLDRFAVQLNITLAELSMPRFTPLESVHNVAAANILQMVAEGEM